MENTESTISKTEEKGTVTTIALKEINKPLFIIFAEFLGYASPLIDWAEDYCDGKELPSYKINILNVDACYIFNEMKKEYTIEEIRKWYDQFYPLILEDYVNRINKRNEKNSSDLPFD